MNLKVHLLSIALRIAFFALCLLPIAAEANGPTRGFIQNKGQVHDQFRKPNQDVLFLLNGAGMNVQLRSNGFAYDTYLAREGERVLKSEGGIPANGEWELVNTTDPSITIDFHRIDIHFVNGDPNAEMTTAGRSEDYTNYYTDVTGEAGATVVRSYTTITYRNVWPHIDVRFNSGDEGFKYDVIVRPGGSLADARFEVKGATISENLKGELVFAWAHGTMRELIPDSWVDNGSKRERVVAKYHVSTDGTFGFEADVSGNGTLVIDPNPVLVWCTYYGSTGSENPYEGAVAMDAAENSYLAGETSASMVIATVGSHDASYNGQGDAFVAKFGPSGSRIWGTYIGGSSRDAAYGMDVTPTGQALIGGFTYSSAGISTAGAYQFVPPGMQDGMLEFLHANGTRQWGTYVGGSGDDQIRDVDISDSGTIGICGRTTSTTAIASTNAADIWMAGTNDAFVGMYTATGARTWQTYLGGTGSSWEAAMGVVFAGTGLAVVGSTGASNGISQQGGATHDLTHNGSYDLFLVRYNTSGTKMWGTYIGGADMEHAYDVEYIALNKLAVCGYTKSTSGIATAGSAQPNYAGGDADGFIACFTASNGIRLWGTYYGEDEGDRVHSVDATGDGRSVAGVSIGSAFAIGPAASRIVEFTEGGAVLSSIALPGSSFFCEAVTTPTAIAATGSTNLYTGVSTPGAWQPTHSQSGPDAWLARLDLSTTLALMTEQGKSAQVPMRAKGDSFELIRPQQWPANGPAQAVVTVTDMHGRIVGTHRWPVSEAMFSVPFGGLAPGAYCAVVQLGDDRHATRFLIP
jgi:hypothetical protein